MSFTIIFSPKSNKQVKSIEPKIKGKIKKAIVEIGENPWHKGTIKIVGYENIRRKRIGKYRILYTLDKKRKEVLVVKIERRDETTYK